MRALTWFLLGLSGLALAIGSSQWPMGWYIRGLLLAFGLSLGLQQTMAISPPMPPRWGEIVKKMLLLLLWSAIGLLGARFLDRSALPYFNLDISEFGRLAPHRAWLFAHIAGGMTAILLGPIQLWPGLRARRTGFHRWVGRVYVLGVLLAGFSAFHLAWYIPNDEGGLPTVISMDVLAIVWLFVTAMAMRAILSRRVQEHREWMIRSYAVTLAFVTIRVQLDLPFIVALGAARVTPYVIWLAWGAPIGLAELIIRWSREARSH